MNDAKIEFYIYRILSGVLLFIYEGEEYELRPADPLTRYKSNIIYQDIIDQEKYNDWFTEENLTKLLIYTNLWTKETPDLINSINKKIENYKIDLYKSRAIKNKTESIRKKIDNLKEQLYRINSLKSDFYSNTLEGYASSIRYEYIICKTLYKNNKKIFDDNIQTNKYSYQKFINIVSIINKHIISYSVLREIAISDLWRSYWTAGHDNLFNKKVADWTEEQRGIYGISQMYDSIYQHPEAPDETVMRDEYMLDGWMAEQKNKNNRQKKQSHIDNINPKLKNANEVFIMPNEDMTVEDIYELNDQDAKMKIKNKINYINSHGGSEIRDDKLPDVQTDIMRRRHQTMNRK